MSRVLDYLMQHNEIFTQALARLDRPKRKASPNARERLRAERERWQELRQGKTGAEFKKAVDATISRLHKEAFADIDIVWVLWELEPAEFYRGNATFDSLRRYVEGVTRSLTGRSPKQLPRTVDPPGRLS